MSTKYQPFQAKVVTAAGLDTTLVRRTTIGDTKGDALKIFRNDEFVIITKEQAMQFFGLIEAPEPIPMDEMKGSVATFNPAKSTWLHVNLDMAKPDANDLTGIPKPTKD